MFQISFSSFVLVKLGTGSMRVNAMVLEETKNQHFMFLRSGKHMLWIEFTPHLCFIIW